MSIEKKVVWLPYDMDTALGINNEGALVFDYGLEDTDHLESGADIFNGQQSVMWVNLREAFGDQIKTMYQNLRSTGALSYEKVEKMFEDHQDKWPEAIFNEDAYFKYIQPLINDGTASYLAMAQGSKAEQRKWWLYNRFRYIDSKYNAGDALVDLIQVRGYAKANITVTPYADIYPTIKYGSYLVSERGHRNVATTLINPLDQVNDTEIYIYSASQLASVGDLSGLKVGFADFSMANKLQSIKVGDPDPNYTNGNLKELYVGNNTLLNSVDARNCPALTGSIDLSGCTNVEHVYFGGTAITACQLPIGGILKTLQLPGTITNLTIRNQGAITSFSMPDYSNITTLRVEYSSNVVPILDILNAMAANSRVRIIGFTMTVSSTTDVENFYDYLDTMRGLDEAGNNLDYPVVSGTLTGLDSITGEWLAQMQARYPNITITYNHISSTLRYYNYDGTQLLQTETVLDGGDGTYTGTPTRTYTAQYSYAFAGWNLEKDKYAADANATKKVETDRNVYAAYTRTVRTYTVTFQNSNGTVLQTVNNVPYGGSATYDGATPKHPTDPDNNQFTGFAPNGNNITGTTVCVAQYRDLRSPTRTFIERTIRVADNSLASVIGSGAFYGCRSLTSVNFPVATSIGTSAFLSCSGLTTVNFPKATFIGSSAFYYCISLTSVNFPAVTSIGNDVFRTCYNLTSVNFPAVTSIGETAFRGCYSLTSVSFPAVASIGGFAFYDCNSLTTAIIGTDKSTVCTLGSTVFGNTHSSLSIYVPDSLVTAYQAARNWSTYSSRIVGIGRLNNG